MYPWRRVDGAFGMHRSWRIDGTFGVHRWWRIASSLRGWAALRPPAHDHMPTASAAVVMRGLAAEVCGDGNACGGEGGRHGS